MGGNVSWVGAIMESLIHLPHLRGREDLLRLSSNEARLLEKSSRSPRPP